MKDHQAQTELVDRVLNNYGLLMVERQGYIDAETAVAGGGLDQGDIDRIVEDLREAQATIDLMRCDIEGAVTHAIRTGDFTGLEEWVDCI